LHEAQGRAQQDDGRRQERGAGESEAAGEALHPGPMIAPVRVAAKEEETTDYTDYTDFKKAICEIYGFFFWPTGLEPF
jgi:hypothetical protein